MNLGKFAALHGEAWARRVLRETLAGRRRSVGQAWPGQIEEARRLAETLSRPALSEALAAIIQEQASVAWRNLARS